MDSEKIAKMLIELHGEKSRETVAKALEISTSAIGMYEIGARIPCDELKTKIARYYNTTVEYIFSLKCHDTCHNMLGLIPSDHHNGQ